MLSVKRPLQRGRNGTVLLVYNLNDADSEIYDSVLKIVTKNGHDTISSCELNDAEAVAEALNKCFCTICLLTPSFYEEKWCDACCTIAMGMAVERGASNVFYVKTNSVSSEQIPAALKGISGLPFPHFAFKVGLQKALTEHSAQHCENVASQRRL